MRRLLRVAVTREEGEDGPLSAALRRHGLAPVRCPAVSEAEPPDPEPLRRAAEALERYDWLVVASARAVDALAALRAAPLPGLRTAAVGSRTAARLKEWGAADTVSPAEPGARALIRLLERADDWPGRGVLHPRAADGGREIAAALRGLGARVDEVVAYRTVPRPAHEIRASWWAGAPGAAVVASPSAARALVGALGVHGLGGVRLVAIGPTTASVLAGFGLRPEVPAHADFASAAALLAAGIESGTAGRSVDRVRAE